MKLFHLAKMTKKSWDIYILAGALLVCLFRLPIFMIFELQQYARVAIFLPLLSLVLVIANSKRLPSISFTGFVYLFCFLWGIFLSLYLYTFEELSIGILISELSSRYIVFVFGFLILTSEISVQKIIKVLEIVSLWTLIIGGLLVIIEGLGYRFNLFLPEQVAGLVIPQNVTQIVGEKYKLFTGGYRAMGFLGVSSNTASILTICTFHQIVFRSSLFLKLGLFVFGFLSVVFTGSLLPLIVLFIGSFILILKEIKSVKYTLIVSAVVMVCVVLFFITPIRTRAVHYWVEMGRYWEVFLPNFSDCFNTPIFGYYKLSAVCNFVELHLTYNAFRYGFIAMAPWYFFVLWPLIRPSLLFDKSGKVLSILYFAFLANSLHYTPIVVWGGNYMFCLVLVGMVKNSLPFNRDHS